MVIPAQLCSYLHCATNNTAATVLSAFRTAVEQFGLPQRVRSDQGWENTEVWHFICEAHEDRSWFIHTQRTNREVMKGCLSLCQCKFLRNVLQPGITSPTKPSQPHRYSCTACTMCFCLELHSIFIAFLSAGITILYQLKVTEAHIK